MLAALHPLVTVEVITSAIKIFGMPYMVFLILLFIIGGILFGFGWYWYQGWKLKQHQQEAKNRVLCEFTDSFGGLVERILCEEYKGEIKTIEARNRATFTTSTFAKPPHGHSIDSYYLLPEHDYIDYWPYGKRSSQQVMVKKYYFTINDPCPKLPRNADKWDSDRYVRITSSIAKLAKDEANLNVLVSEMSGVWQNIEDFKNKLKYVIYCVIGIVIVLFVQAMTGFIVFDISGKIGTIYRFVVGG